MDVQAQPDSAGWGNLPKTLHMVPRDSNLRKNIAATLFVGPVLFLINQLDVVVSGHATPLVWLKIATTFLVPFCVSNYGVLVATHRGRS